MSSKPVVIIGGGIAGLNCARELSQQGIDFVLLEASDGLGGRMRTDEVAGYRLDRGFQVFQTAYPEAQRALDYQRLQLTELEPGALIRRAGKWHRMADPLRRPGQAFATLFNGIGNIGDRFKLLRLRRDCSQIKGHDWLLQPDDISTLVLLQEHYRFSPEFLNGFLRPWLAGIFLESDLHTSANQFRFVFNMLSAGPISYPRLGIQALPDQLADSLPAASIRLRCPAKSVDHNHVLLADGESMRAERIVLATDQTSTTALLGTDTDRQSWNGTTCVYFTADRAPSGERSLMLNGDQRGLVNHVFIPTNSVKDLAPLGKTLISVSTIGTPQLSGDALTTILLNELRDWFGDGVDDWQHLKTYTIPRAVLDQPAGGRSQHPHLPAGILLCGDQAENGSVNGALRSGRLAAESVQAASEFVEATEARCNSSNS